MIRWWIKLAALTASLAPFPGGCSHVHDGERRQDMIDSAARCTLSPEALAKRKSAIKASLGSKILERTELDDGVAIRFATDSQTIQAVFDFVTAERSCCGSFLTFEVILNGGDGTFWLRLRGDSEGKELLKDMFNVDARPPIGGTSPG